MKKTCVQCRVRKVRCDGSVPCCKTCERLQFHCSFQRDTSQPVGQYVPRLPPKRRGAKACLECRAMKVRCSGATPRCHNCHRRDRQCTYPSSTGPTSPALTRVGELPSPTTSASDTIASDGRTVSQSSPSIPIPSGPSSPSNEVVSSLLRDYFDRLYPLPSFNFLHKDTVVRRCSEGTIDESLKLAICAITALYFGQYKSEHVAWAQQSEQLILDRLERPSIFLIQASLLTIRYRAGVGQFPRAFILAGLAARWAVSLRLNYEHSGLGLIAQEVRRRTFWSLYLLEDSFCVGLKEFELFDPEIIHLQLPCEDEDFHNERPVLTGFLHPGKGLEPEILGARAAFVKLAFVRRGVMRLNRRICAKEVSLAELFRSVERFQSDLHRLRSRLAPTDQYPPTHPGELHWPARYAILHMSWHQCHCDLYRIFLSGYPESTPHPAVERMTLPERVLMKDKCFGHAEQIVKVLSDFVHHKDEQHMLDFDVAVCAYHAARLILFGTYTGRSDEALPMQMAIYKAQLCLDVITRYFGFSAQLKSMRQILERAILQHKKWLESSDHRPVATADPSPHPPVGISRDAYMRQRLAIHSLLRQSDFVDDSCDAAPEPTRPLLSWTASTEDDQMPQPASDWDGRGIVDPVTEQIGSEPNLFCGLEYGLDLLGWAVEGTEEALGFIGELDEQFMY
ncbi:hypothetical protein BDV24DRAFT_168151 [Aspergillus arachidicola]|uniref:Zn(2)-C6 fungal-type domain-containing protein n=1 Tax=Aspergillus arachidicola TaxID=656916 RepID=A0A5N6XTT9_9EURO|nr:hypothetical protein BDV24DRAFT_168151 [Aspergillus arachidicola]